jgi:drug/metabolite transporter (DMT)-like permease
VFAIFSNVVPFALIAWAEQHIDSGVTSVLNSTMPLFTALFAAAILIEEEFTPGRILGLVAGVAGVAVLAGGDILDITDSGVVGQLAVVGAAACYGAMGVYARTLLRSHDPVTLTGVQLALGTVVALLVTLPVEGVPDYGALSLKAWGALLVLGLIGSGVSQWVYLWLVDHTGSVRASLVTYIIPIMGLLLGWLVLDEHIGPNVIVGFALIVAGVAAVLRGQAPSSQRAVIAPEIV